MTLRTALLWLGALLTIGGLILSVETCGAGIGLVITGIVLLLAPLIERYRYKRIVDTVPGPDWQPTGERFIEPGKDVAVAVYYHQPSGKRVYVRLGDGSA
jgi:hypothetical protein